ncbi:GtrA family protein [Paenibacillus marinisediminis]
MMWLRYGLVGVCNSLVGLGLVAILMHVLHWTHGAAAFCGNAVGILFSYAMNRSFTFKSQVNPGAGLLRFIGVSLICYAFAYVVLHQPISSVISSWLPVEKRVWLEDATVLAEAVIYTITSFLLHRIYTFHKQGEPSSEPTVVEGHAELK